MRRIFCLTAAVGILVYAVAATAQPAMAPAKPTPMVVKAPKKVAPKPAAPAMAAVVAPVAPVMAAQPAPAAMAPAVAQPVAMAPEKPAAAQPAAPSTKSEPPKAQPKQSGWDKADKWVSRITSLLLALLTVIGLILGWVKGKDWRQKLKSDRWQKIMGYVDKAFPMVEKLADATAWKGDDKLVEFMKRVNDWLKGEGEPELTTDEMVLLKREAADKAAVAKAENGGGEVDEKLVKRDK